MFQQMSIRREWSFSIQHSKLLGPPTCAQTVWHSNQILHGNQIRGRGNFLRFDHAPALAKLCNSDADAWSACGNYRPNFSLFLLLRHRHTLNARCSSSRVTRHSSCQSSSSSGPIWRSVRLVAIPSFTKECCTYAVGCRNSIIHQGMLYVRRRLS